MITVEEAEAIILQHTLKPTPELVPLEEALGRVLAEDLFADRDFPPFDRVTMDGIALAYATLAQGQTRFQIAMTVAAGQPQAILNDTTQCVEVMTGAMLPVNTDVVVRYEDLHIENNIATINVIPEKSGINIHTRGADKKATELLVAKGRRITPAEIGVAATIGKHKVWVQKRVSAIVIATGEEIIPITETPLPHQIRTSNSYALQAALKSWGVAADIVLLPDNQLVIEAQLQQFLQSYDVLVLSGGVSAGKFDFVPQALANQGVQQLFHKVSQRPGKPFWFGIKQNTGKVVFALPGNPVSTFMCLHRYFRPWLDASLGLPTQRLMAELGKNFVVKFPLTFFLQVKLEETASGIPKAIPIEGNGSGDLVSLTATDAFMELPLGTGTFREGEKFVIWKYR